MFLQCGRPVEVKVCPECKVNIGGRGYALSQGNTMAQRCDTAVISFLELGRQCLRTNKKEKRLHS